MQGRIRKSYGPISSGTRCEIIKHFHKEGTVEVKVGPFSKAFYEQNHPVVEEIKENNDHMVIPFELVELVRSEH